MINQSITFRALKAHDDIEDVQKVLNAAPDYAFQASGKAPSTTAAFELFNELPEGFDPSRKYVYAIDLNGTMIGCIDMLRGFPVEDTVMLGLFLLSEKHQGKGMGSKVFKELELFLSKWPETKKCRIGVLVHHEQALTFWRKMNFLATGAKRLHDEGLVKSEVLVFEKYLK